MVAMITKTAEQKVHANLQDYERECQSFSWPRASESLSYLDDGKALNIAYEAVDRQVLHFQRGAKVALRCCRKDGRVHDYTYAELANLTSRLASSLKTLELGRGEGLFILSQRIPELYIAVLGGLKAGAVVTTLFAAFGPEPIASRLKIGQGRILMTTESFYRKKIQPIRQSLTNLRKIIILDAGDPAYLRQEGLISFAEMLEHGDPNFPIVRTMPGDPALLHFTSGTTGLPKGALHVHGAVLAHYITAHYALDLHPDDIYWCTADPGWVTGVSYGIIAPLCHGLTMLVDEAEFDAERWYQLIETHRVSVWYTAPTAIRMMMKFGEQLAIRYQRDSLRFIASVGEPLNPEAVKWGIKAFGLPIHDNWWQTETGGIMIANYAGMDIKPGSMGRPLPGITASIVQRQGEQIRFLAPGEDGELAIKVPWPSMFRTYLGQEERYRQCFVGDWYLSGDLARCDSDGYFWFVGRSDDVIKSAGHLIGPFEVESALIEHPAVAEAAVIGVPDPLLLERVKAFVSLRSGFESSEQLQSEIMAFARKKLGVAVAPREIVIVPSLPRTRSGKIMRRILRARELGLPEGDISTLEEEPKSATL